MVIALIVLQSVLQNFEFAVSQSVPPEYRAVLEGEKSLEEWSLPQADRLQGAFGGHKTFASCVGGEFHCDRPILGKPACLDHRPEAIAWVSDLHSNGETGLQLHRLFCSGF
jgi:hypothetical protein